MLRGLRSDYNLRGVLSLIPLSRSFNPTVLLLTVRFDQHLLLAHVLHVDGAVDNELRRGAVVVFHLLTLVALDLKGAPCSTEQAQHDEEAIIWFELQQHNIKLNVSSLWVSFSK